MEDVIRTLSVRAGKESPRHAPVTWVTPEMGILAQVVIHRLLDQFVTGKGYLFINHGQGH